MTPRRLLLDPDTLALLRPDGAEALTPIAPVGWLRKSFAVALHAVCLSLFGLLVVWPVVAPIAGELPGSLRPVLASWSEWAWEGSAPDPAPRNDGDDGDGADGGRHGCAPVCSHGYVR